MPKPVLLPTNRPPTTPGEMLLNEFLVPLGLTITEFAERIGASRIAISEIVNGRRAVSSIMAIRLGRALSMSDEFWINLQTMTDLYAARNSAEAKAIAELAPIVKHDKKTNETTLVNALPARKPPGPKAAQSRLVISRNASPRRRRVSSTK